MLTSSNQTLFKSLFQTILTLSESYYQTILTYLELVSNSIHTFIELIPNSCLFNEHLNRQKILKGENSEVKCEKLVCTHEADNFAINCSWVYKIGHSWLYGRE